MADSKVNLLNRLVDYFLVVGLSEDHELDVLVKEDGRTLYKPHLIDRYPPKDYEDIPFPPGIEIFGIPGGIAPKESIELPKFHHFAATLGNGDRLYGTCLRFDEPVPDKLVRPMREAMEADKRAAEEQKRGEEVAEQAEREEKKGEAEGEAVGVGSVELQFEEKGDGEAGDAKRENGAVGISGSASINNDGNGDQDEKGDGNEKGENNEKGDEDDENKDNGSEKADEDSTVANGESKADGKKKKKSADDGTVAAASGPAESGPSASGDEHFAEKNGDGAGSSSEVSDKNTEKNTDKKTDKNTDKKTDKKSDKESDKKTVADDKKAADDDKETSAAGETKSTAQQRSDGSPSSQSAVSKRKTRTLYATKCIIIISHYGFFNQYLDFLTELYRISLSPSQIPMERYIVNFARETPLPPQGCFSIHYKIGQKSIEFSRAPPNHPLDQPPFPYSELFRVLTTENVIKLVTALLLEYRVVLVADQYTTLTAVSELAIRLMYPFIFEHVYIPILPKTLLDFVSAPMPFFIGIPRAFIAGVDFQEMLEEHENMILVDIDADVVHVTEEITPIAPAELRKLRRMVEPMKKLYRPRDQMTALELKTLKERDSAFNYVPNPEETDDVVTTQPKIDIDGVTSVQAAFLRVFVSLFKDYRRFLVFPKEPPPSTTPADGPSGDSKASEKSPTSPLPDDRVEDEPSFDTDTFIRKQSKESHEFLRKLCVTQAFTRFTDTRVAPGPMPGERENFDIRFFDECIIAKSNRSRFRRTRPTPFLVSKEFDIKDSFPAPEPDATGLPSGKAYQHRHFPRLNPELFQGCKDKLADSTLATNFNKPTVVKTTSLPSGSGRTKVVRPISMPDMSSVESVGKLVKQYGDLNRSMKSKKGAAGDSSEAETATSGKKLRRRGSRIGLGLLVDWKKRSGDKETEASPAKYGQA